MLRTLSSEYVNAWVLAKDLEALAQRSGDEDVAELCALVKKNYGYPVDSVLVTPDLRVVGHVNVNEAAAHFPDLYVKFLRRGLALARGEELPPELEEEPAAPPPATLRLTPAAPEGSVLDVVRVGKSGSFELRFFALDASAFAGPVEVELEVRLGTAEAAGSFELCAASPGAPDMMAPVATLARVGPGESGILTHGFARGALFGLAAKGLEDKPEGSTNAFLATVRVRAR